MKWERHFFFEKKKQKTFASLDRVQRTKVFLLLFLQKKKSLSSAGAF
jgi:hypothetical protein